MVEKRSIPYIKTIFVCTNVREGGKVACANPGRGGDEICEKLKAYIKERGLKGKIRAVSSGCLDLCAQGPNVFVYPVGRWYSGVRQEDIAQLIKEIGCDRT
ncbi:MAG: (2Fe-2S) ferredoxin domain-containing protein [Elusimicrobia bacterium]|nr:(2Fe-2S) ferredoxin domain-containing protein [Elusimicrobiota bacterium]